MGYKDDNYSTKVCGHHPETCTCRDWDTKEEPKQERMYSEEEVINLLNKREDYLGTEPSIFDYSTNEQWFEQFKINRHVK